MKISSLCHIKFTDKNGHDDTFIDGGLPIVPLNCNVLIRWESGDEHIQTIHLINEKSKLKTSLTLTPVNNDAYYVKFTNVPCGIYRLQVNDGYLTGRKIKSLPFRIVRNSKGIVQIRTTNFNDDRYRRNNIQEYNYYYAYLSNWCERTKEKVTKYDNERGNVIPLVSHAFNTYDLQTTATAQHTINLLNEISNNDFINISFLNRQGERQYFEVKRTNDAPSNTNYNRTNQGTFAATFVGEWVGREIRNGHDGPNIHLIELPNAQSGYQSLPISELCHGISNIEYDGYVHSVADYSTINMPNITEIPDNFMNFEVYEGVDLFKSGNVRKIGTNFGHESVFYYVDFSNVESIGKNFRANFVTGAIALPNEIENFYVGNWGGTKFFGNNVKLKGCKTSVFANTGVSVANVNDCFVDSVDLIFADNAVIENSTFQAYTIVGGIETPTNFQLPNVKGLTIRNSNFEKIDSFSNYKLDLSKFVGSIENSFRFANNTLTITEDSLPTFKVDNNSFTGVYFDSAYLRTQIDNIRRSNTSSGVYKNEIQVSGMRYGITTNFAVKQMSQRLMEINNQSVVNEMFDGTTDTITFLAGGEYYHPEHFLENAKIDNGVLDFREGMHHFSNYFLNNVQITKIQMYYSQFMELMRTNGFSPNGASVIEVFDDSASFDLYYMMISSENLVAEPYIYFSETLTDIHDKMITLGYSHVDYLH